MHVFVQLRLSIVSSMMSNKSTAKGIARGRGVIGVGIGSLEDLNPTYYILDLNPMHYILDLLGFSIITPFLGCVMN